VHDLLLPLPVQEHPLAPVGQLHDDPLQNTPVAGTVGSLSQQPL